MSKNIENLKKSHKSGFQLLDISINRIHVKQLIAGIDRILMKQNNSNLYPWKKAHYKAIKNWLLKYKPVGNNPSNLEKVTGYIEALYHICQVEDWDKVKKILSIDINANQNFSNYKFHYQLGVWGLYKQQISIYSSLLGKIDDKWNCRFLEGLGNAYDALGNYDKAINYRQQWRQLAQDIKDKKEEGKALCSLGINLDDFPGDLVLAALIDSKKVKLIKHIPQKSQYRAVINWVTKYQANQETSDLAKLKGLLEAFFHLCEVEAWLEAKAIMLIRINTPTNEELHEQLQTWGFYEETIGLYQRLLGKLDARWEATSLTGIGKISNAIGDFNQAIHYFKNSQNITKQIGDLQSERNALSNLGKTYHFLGNDSNALQAHLESLSIAKKIGDRIGEGLVMSDLGVTYSAIEDNKKALFYLEKSLHIAQSNDNKIGQAMALEGLAIFYLQQNDYEHTVEYSQQQLTIAREIGYRQSEATSLRNLGKAQTYFLEHSKACQTLESALKICQEINDRYNEAICFYYLAQFFYDYGYFEKAKSLFSKVLRLSQWLNIPCPEKCLELLKLIK
ncbi:tetratricopeptide repeat protein [Moorena sp. SIO3H5]|uniref:tetratricopeptide repeat protein n=1 Tax=Moorena sp. SIO3H5 TaxID=2607834 RepID=UPI0013B6A0C8|nr:tetratricopeptide repeat protein [Moorena sp. SIO3H5]NEO68701.1 tetratricopeptide repeat protein [Moorena sp. SIO3H5]